MTRQTEGDPTRVGQGDRETGERRTLWRGVDQATSMSTELIAAILTWSFIGYLADRWLDTGPWLLVTGALIGNAAGIYLIYLRSSRMDGYNDFGKKDAVSPSETDVTGTTTDDAAGTVAPERRRA